MVALNKILSQMNNVIEKFCFEKEHDIKIEYQY